MGAQNVMYKDSHIVIFAGHRQQTEIGGEDILADGRVIIIAVGTGVATFAIIVVGPVEVAVIVVITASIETATFFLELDLIIGKQLFFTFLDEVFAGIGGQIPVERQFHPVDGAGFGVDQFFQIDRVGIPTTEILGGVFIEEDRFTRDQATDTHQVTRSFEIIHLKELSDVLFEYLDDTHYYATLDWTGPATFSRESEKAHTFLLQLQHTSTFSFTCCFSPEPVADVTEPVASIERKSAASWEKYWRSGAAVDLSGSKDPRWLELERRIVLSQYLMRANESGLFPPQESGLVNNGWFGRFHFEMIWWHGVHYGLWNRMECFDNYLNVYKDFMPKALERAKSEGRSGARWPKCTGNFNREWPGSAHAYLIWHEPHPIYFAEMQYRQKPAPETLEKWKDVVLNTADYMADYLFYDKKTKQYVLGPPVVVVSENTDPLQTINPIFELGYFRYGLRTALEWADRLGLSEKRTKKWKEVLSKMAPLPVADGVYTTYEGIPDMWTKYTYEHPALTGVYGMLPGDGVDQPTFKRTLEKVSKEWQFNRIWGWDFPMLAMAAARTGQPALAIDMLMHPSAGFQFDEHGLATGGPFPYFPSNGALLTAVAMMCGGWDGSEGEAPGFPKDGSWTVRYEGFVPMQ